MKTYLNYAVAILLATITVATAAPDKDALMEKENTAWQSFKDKNADAFKKVVSANMIAVYAEGFSDMAKELADMQKWDMKSFTISDYRITAFGSDTVIATYKVTIAGTYDGKDASGIYNAASVWKENNGTWQAIYHTNVKEAGPASRAQKKE